MQTFYFFKGYLTRESAPRGRQTTGDAPRARKAKASSASLNTNRIGGAERDRTADPLLAKQVLSQLSYSPIVSLACRTPFGPALRRRAKRLATATALRKPSGFRSHRTDVSPDRQIQPKLVGPGRLELPTSRLSGVRSNHLSYGPIPGRTRPRAGFVILLKKEKRGRRVSPFSSGLG